MTDVGDGPEENVSGIVEEVVNTLVSVVWGWTVLGVAPSLSCTPSPFCPPPSPPPPCLPLVLPTCPFSHLLLIPLTTTTLTDAL
jgi:hypothetical protein